MTKKTAVTIFFTISLLFSGVYLIFNAPYDVSYPSSKRLYDPENKYPEKQKELQNQSYFFNGREQGALDAKCTSWICAYDLFPSKGTSGYRRGSIISPFQGLRILSHKLNTDERSYYNSGYIKGYAEVCPKYHSDCEVKINKMQADFLKYFNKPAFDVSAGVL